MSPELSVMYDAVKVIHFIQSKPMNHKLFQNLCHDSGSEHEQLLLPTDVCWLRHISLSSFCGNTLPSVWTSHWGVYFPERGLAPLCSSVWGHRVDFTHILLMCSANWITSTINSRKDSHVLNLDDKLNGFIMRFKEKRRDRDVGCFPLLDAHHTTTDVDISLCPNSTLISTRTFVLFMSEKLWFHL